MSAPADMSDCVLGMVDYPTGQIYDSRSMTRAAAQRAFANEWGVDFASVRCTTRWARWMTLQEQWEWSGMDRWTDNWEPPDDDDDAEPPDAPDTPPEGWEADPECDPAWQFCESTHPDAVKVYVCEPQEAA